MTIKNWTDCVLAGPDGAICFHELSDETKTLTKLEWDQQSFGYLCSSRGDFAEKKAAYESLCQVSDLCDYDTKVQIDKFNSKVSKINARVDKLKNKK